MENENSGKSSLVYSYLTHRKAIGILGISLPFIVSLGGLIVFNTGLQSSISSYYHTDMRDVLVGTLFAVGFFLLSYRGYERTDDIAGDLACIFAIGVALFPTAPQGGVDFGTQIIGYVHAAFTVLFFSTLSFFSLYLFTKTNPNKPPTRRKLQRNTVYKVCGYTMIVCLLLIVIDVLLPADISSLIENYRPVFWLEAVAIFAFGVSWFTKGEAILKDQV